MPEQTTITEASVLKIPATVKNLIEALIFAADEPLTVRQLKAIYEGEGTGGEERRIEQPEIQQAVHELNEEYQRSGKPYRIIAIAGGYQFATVQEYAEWIGRLYKEQSRRKLSQSSLETLAIVAYKQPVSKPEIELIRGVNCDYVLHTLLEKELVTIVGRAETVGRPLLYGTTREFLTHFGLNEVTDLPRPREIEEILGETQFETERRMLEAQQGADLAKKEEEDFKSRLPHIPKKKPDMDATVQIIPKRRSREINIRPRKEADAPIKEKETPSAPPEEPWAVGLPSGNELPKPDEVLQSPETSPMVHEETQTENMQSVLPGVRAPGAEIPSAKEVPDQAREGTERASAQATADDEAIQSTFSQPVPVGEPTPPRDVHPNIAVEPPRRAATPPDGPGEEAREPEETQPRIRTWSLWKQKIQSFIKKLFG